MRNTRPTLDSAYSSLALLLKTEVTELCDIMISSSQSASDSDSPDSDRTDTLRDSGPFSEAALAAERKSMRDKSKLLKLPVVGKVTKFSIDQRRQDDQLNRLLSDYQLPLAGVVSLGGVSSLLKFKLAPYRDN